MTREEIESAICKVMGVFPEELKENLPNTFGEREMKGLLEAFDQYHKQGKLEELQNMLGWDSNKPITNHHIRQRIAELETDSNTHEEGR